MMHCIVLVITTTECFFCVQEGFRERCFEKAMKKCPISMYFLSFEDTFING